MKYLLTEKKAIFALKIIIPIFIAIVSYSILATTIPEMPVMKNTVESIDKSKETVASFAAATTAVSLVISALPDDFATPLAQNFADLNKYFIIILVFIFLEKLIVIEGSKIALAFIIPFACLIYIISEIIRQEKLRKFSFNIAILALAIVLLIPVSTSTTNLLCKDYLAYVDDTISEVDSGAKNVNSIIYESDEDKSVFDKLSDAFKTAIEGVKDMLNYFNELIKRCIKSIAILVVSDMVVPVIVLFIFKWIIGYLFSRDVNIPELSKYIKNVEKIKNKKDTEK